MTNENVRSGGREIAAIGLLAVSLIFLLGWIFDPANVIRVTRSLCFIIGPPFASGIAFLVGGAWALDRKKDVLGYFLSVLGIVCLLISAGFMAVLDP